MIMEVKIGDNIHIVNMVGESNYDGKEGVVTSIDDAGQIHGTWGGCALLINVDDFYVVQDRLY